MAQGNDRFTVRGGLAWRIAVAASVLTTVVVLLLGTVSYRAMQDLTRDSVTQSLKNYAYHQSEDTGVRLTNIGLALNSLADNTLIGNALVDDLGRDVYLKSFLFGYNAVGDVPIQVFVTNYRGRPFASNSGNLRMAVDESWTRNAVDTGETQIKIVDSGGLAFIVVAQPILYVNTGLPEGALIFQFSLWDLVVPAAAKHRRTADLPQDFHIIVSMEQDGKVYEQAVGTSDTEALISEVRAINTGLPFSTLAPKVRVSANASVLEAPLTRLLYVYLIVGLVVVVLVIVTSIFLANRLAARLRSLEFSAAEIVAEGSFDRRLPADGHDETALLAQTFNDVLDRLKTAYADMERRNRIELDHSHEKYRHVVEQAGDAMLIFDSLGHIVEANRSASLLLKFPYDKLTGKTIDDLTGEGGGGRTFDRQYKELLDSGSNVYEAEFKRSDGRPVWVEIHASLITLGNSHQILWMLQDISARRDAEELRTRLLAKLEESNTELRQFAYVASHDLQEPLRMVTSYLQLLERRYGERLDGDARDYIDFAVDGATRMSRLIRDLLSYSRLDTKGEPFVAVPVAPVLVDALQNLAVAVEEAGAQIILPEHTPSVWGDQTQLLSLFQNLIGNAVKYRADGRAPVITVDWQTSVGEPGFVHFTVTDNGIGIPGEFHSRIFMIFQRLHGREDYEGTGIGLAMCKRIVERHHGRIWVDSKPDEGSVFHFLLPDSETGPKLAANDD